MGGTTGIAVAALMLAATAAAPVTDDAVRAEVDKLVAEVSAARHLPYRGMLPARAVTRDAAGQHVSAALGGAVLGTRIGVEERMLAYLGLIPASADYVELVAKAFGPALAPGGYYDATSGRLLVPDFLPLAAQRLTLSHEVAHAIADQRFGIRRLLRATPEDGRALPGDAQRARLALIEGDANLATLELADPKEGFLGARELRGVADRLRAAVTVEEGAAGRSWLARLGTFTHVDGLMFVARVRARKPWAAVDALWTDPAASSEQVLHPEKYDACEEPVRLDEDLLPTLADFGRPKATDVLGELVIRAWLARSLPGEIAERAAAGWAGDLAAIYAAQPAPPGQAAAPDGGAPAAPPLAWLTVWDDPSDAEDFARAAADAGVKVLARRGEAVALLVGADADPNAAVAQMLDGWQRQKAAARKTARGKRAPKTPACARRER